MFNLNKLQVDIYILDMLSVYANPLTFDSKKNHILLGSNKIEWKKQIATVCLKKGMSLGEFVQNKIMDKFAALSPTSGKCFMVGHFDYLEGKSIYLFGVSGSTKTILDYNSHIPNEGKFKPLSVINPGGDSDDGDGDDPGDSLDMIKMNGNNDGIVVSGMVYGLCFDNKTYYIEQININDYIDFVQNEEEDLDGELEEDVVEEDADGEENIDSDSNGEDSTEEEDVEDVEEDDETIMDNPDDSEKDPDDGQNDLEDDPDIDNTGDVDDKDDATIDDGDDGDDVDDDSDHESDDSQSGETIDMDDEYTGTNEIDDYEPEEVVAPKPAKKQTKSKAIKIQHSMDLSIIFNILVKEDNDIITPVDKLHTKRKQVIEIFNKLPLDKKIIKMVEKGIYNYAIDRCNAKSSIPLWDNMEFVDIYISKAKNLYSNLNENCYVKNTNLITQVKTGKIKPEELAFIESYKLYPEKWMDIIEEKAKIEKILKESLQESATDLFQCHRCHKRKTIYCEVQTRSSDEPMTKFITCLECGNKWKKY